MGGQGSGRKPKGYPVAPKAVPIANNVGFDNYILPNHSGDNSAGRVLRTPTTDYDIANKKYVDNALPTDYWKTLGAQTGLTGDKTGSFDLTTTGTLQATTFTDGTMTITNDQATDLLRFFNTSNSDSVALFGTDGGISVRTTDSNIRAGYFDDGTAIAKIASTIDSGEYFKFYLSASESTDYVRFLYGTGLEVRNDTNSSALTVRGDSILLGDLTIGDGTNDAVLTFDSTNNGIITWDSSDQEFEFGDAIRMTATDDSYGRALKGGLNYNLSTASNSQTFAEIQADGTTHGNKNLTGGNFQARMFGTNATQTASVFGGQFSTYIAGDQNVNYPTGGYFLVGLNNNATVTRAVGCYSRIFNYNTKTGTITNSYNFYAIGDAEDGTITNMHGLHVDNFLKDTGTITTAAGVYLDEQTNGSTNYQIYSAAGDNYFGNGTHTFVGTMKFGTHNSITTETLSGYITITDSGGTTRKLAVVS